MKELKQFDLAKEKAIILLILNRCGSISKQKLIHLLYFICFDYWEKEEESICGFTFMKTPRGIEILGLDKILKEL